MEEISKVEVIYEAFKDTVTKKLPRKESDYPDWYKERLGKCNSCKYNTKNIPSGMLPTSLYISKKLGKNRCSICTCFIKQKAWMKVEECAIAETEERPSWMDQSYIMAGGIDRPLWNRLSLVTSNADDFNIISTDSSKYNIGLSEDGNIFEIKLEPVKAGNNAEFSFIVQSNKPMEMSGTDTSCGCTSPSVDILSENEFKFNMSINTSGFGEGRFVKSMNFRYYYDRGAVEQSASFMFIGSIISNDEEKH